MSDIVWIEYADCVAIHERLIAQFGGLAGIRDEGLLLSALAKPKNLYAYGKPDMSELAASIAAGIILNHPFHDGNKRSGFLLAVLFLEMNGCKFIATEESVFEKTLAFAAREISERDYAVWLADNIE